MQDDAIPAGYARCPSCKELYSLDVGVCEDCMLAPLKAQESQQEVGWVSLTLAKQREAQAKLEKIAAVPDADANHYCPNCLEEYRPDIELCGDCEEELVTYGRLKELYTPEKPVEPTDGEDGCPRCGGPLDDEDEVCKGCAQAEKEAIEAKLAKINEWVEGRLSHCRTLAAAGEVLLCPVCEVEYRPDFETCSDCDVGLVEPSALVGLLEKLRAGVSSEVLDQEKEWSVVHVNSMEGTMLIALELSRRLDEKSLPYYLTAAMNDGPVGPEPTFAFFVRKGDEAVLSDLIEMADEDGGDDGDED